MIKPREGTLVLVKPSKGPPKDVYFGLVDRVFDGENGFMVKDDFGEVAPVFPQQIISVAQTDKDKKRPKTPREAVRKHYDQILINIICAIYSGEAVAEALHRGSLVIVLPGGKSFMPSAQWGLVVKKVMHGYEVIVGRKWFRGQTKIIEPAQMIPVVKTDLSEKNPVKALRKHWDSVLMHIILKFYAQEGASTVQRLLMGLSSLGTVTF